jgi:hypothetical protein
VGIFLLGFVALGPHTPAQDCNRNGIDDSQDINSGASRDCNRNGTPDECDIAPVEFGLRIADEYRFDETILIGVVAPESVAVADFDGDGNPDAVSANSRTNAVALFVNRGDGMFLDPVEFSVGEHPTTVVAVDLDHDGDDDIATANYEGKYVSILFNQGDLTFAPGLPLAVGNATFVVGGGGRRR